MRILFLLTNYFPYIGGSEEVFKHLAEGLAKRGHSVQVVTSLLPGTPSNEELNQVSIHRCRIPRFAYQFLYTFFVLFPAIRMARDCDIIHTSSNYSALAARVVSYLLRKPLVLTCHEVLGKRWRQVETPLRARVYQWVEHLVVNAPYDRYVTGSQAASKDLIQAGVSPDRVSVIYWGFDGLFPNDQYESEGKLRRLCGIDDHAFLCVYYGRPGVTKGVEYLLKAVPEIQSKIPDSHFALILSREPEERFRSICGQIKEDALVSKVHLIEPFSDRAILAQHLVDANCIMIPSITEGFGLTTIEACNLGIPVVASCVGSIPEVIFGRYVLVEPCSPSALVDGAVRIFQRRWEQAPPKLFTWNATVNSYEQLYEELL